MFQFIDKHYPVNKVKEELDKYLSHGWYRMGQTVFTTHFLYTNDNFCSTIWLRQDLNKYTPSKSARKLLRTNNKKYKIEITPFSIDKEKEYLFQAYKQHFPEDMAPSLSETLFDGAENNIFDTFEIAVYLEEKLIACSFFDKGKDSLASIIGIYDPKFKKDSLGLYTMLLELDYCKQIGIQYFYPGYVVPGSTRFEYKLRIGKDLEYYDLGKNKWYRFIDLKMSDTPINRLENKLREANTFFELNYGIHYKHYKYPLFDSKLFGFVGIEHLNFPEWLLCGINNELNKYLMLVFNPFKNVYQLYICAILDLAELIFLENYFEKFNEQNLFKKLLMVEKKIVDVENIVDVKQYINQFE